MLSDFINSKNALESITDEIVILMNEMNVYVNKKMLTESHSLPLSNKYLIEQQELLSESEKILSESEKEELIKLSRFDTSKYEGRFYASLQIS
ncbi:hypothetical protein X975_00128, partial [Stegodyphus mimosarum]